MNKLYYGDNLAILRGGLPNVTAIPEESVDLIYLDPPFNSARNYNLLFKQHKGQSSPAQIMAFEDTWQWSQTAFDDFRFDERNQPLWELILSLYKILGESEMMAYVVMMAPRLLELHRKLKKTGSLYLHCDPVASHYLKIILDVIFGPQNFINEITWKRTSAHNDARRKFADITDIILAYGRTSGYKFVPQYTAYDQTYLDRFYRHVDDDGRRYRLDNLRSPNPRPNLTYHYKGFPPHRNGWAVSLEKMEMLDREGRLHFPSKPDGRIALKRYLDEMPGTIVGNLWDDVNPVSSQAAERRGYPTQKPLALLERIIAASSNPGDVVLDPFAGCGTAIVAAERMNRQWIGIDITYLAINEILDRLKTEHADDRPLSYTLEGTPKDAHAALQLFESTKAQNHKPFEQWAVTLVGGRWQDKMGKDGGKDGVIPIYSPDGKSLNNIVIQVKGGDSLGLSFVRDFGRVIARENAVIGIMISQKPPTKDMLKEAQSMGFADWPTERRYPRYQILTIKQLLEDGVKPEIPDSYRPQLQQGVGRAKSEQDTLDLT